MRVTSVPIGEVVPYERNPRKNEAAVGKVAKSLREYGWQQPIVVDEKNVVIAGHTRLAAARLLGFETVPVHRATGLTAAQVKAYRIADNRTSEEATWHDDFLRMELAEIDLAGMDLSLTGMDEGDLSRLLPDDEPEPKPIDASVYGGATAVARASAPIRFWRERGDLEGRVLDFGCGREEHEFARFDAFTQPAHDLLLQSWDVVMCNYVLNVQPSDHLVLQIAALIRAILEPSGKALFAIVSKKELAGTGACGGRSWKSQAEWQELLSVYFDAVPIPDAKAFFAFVSTPRAPE